MPSQENKVKKIDLEICKDARMLFTRERSGHVGYMQYGSSSFTGDVVTGDNIWAQARLNPSYYLGREEDDLVRLITDEFRTSGPTVSSVLELGPGDHNALLTKTIPLINSLKVQEYIAIDMAETYARNASNFISEQCSIKGQYVVSNFLEDALHVRQSNALMFMGGSTISNVTVNSTSKNVLPYLTSELMILRDYVDEQSYFLVGFDANQDPVSLSDSYCFEEHAKLIENILWRVARDTNFVLKPQDFEYDGQWIPEEYRFAHNVVCKKRTEVKLDDRTVYLDSGEKLLLENSYKYPLKMVETAAEGAGWSIQNFWTITGRAYYMLLKAA